MEVAGQWRREWAGSAEYGKVTEGGVTRRVARAMEVLHASAPGARVRVMRAAYHSSSGPGIPASSYMLHSSRRVISSGFNILESPTFPSKPLEISSTPLDSSPECIETENYKVTEPDDMDISEPSKWRGTTGGNSIRMPSEESSSTDNASIIDLDARLHHKGLHRKYSYDSENSDVHSIKRNSARASPLLDPPVTLSTLKYKSLLNNSNDWNNRRKSYSFEDTSPLNEIMVQSNDTLAMESSTDSGICKSTELVNDYSEDVNHIRDIMRRENRFQDHRDNPIDNRQYKNKPNTFRMKPYKEHDIVIEDSQENNIALQSSGKVTITVPITIEGAEDNKNKKVLVTEEGDRKVKKVGFCKTELHFAAESGRVNIIATDEKPPPSNDFRKRRSAFVPINDKYEKPITLFGDKNDTPENIKLDEFEIRDFSESAEYDENTAATKSILKNKIPKPKPYLLGENMAFGETSDLRLDQTHDNPVSAGVSLINKELESQRVGYNKETIQSFSMHAGFSNSLRTINKGPIKNASTNIERKDSNERLYSHLETKSSNDSIQHKLKALQMSPVQKPKTRQLRESDLTFFGIDNYQNSNSDHKKQVEQKTSLFKGDFSNDTFESVRLIKQISNSAQNSEAESDDYAEYQNIPMKNNFAPVPTPRSRVKYKKPDADVMVLKPIIEQAYDSSKTIQESRRSRSRKQDEFITMTSRSRSEPAKNHKRDNTVYKYIKQENGTERNKHYDNKTRNKIIDSVEYKNEDDVPLYANLDTNGNKNEIIREAGTRVRDVVSTLNNKTNENKIRVKKSTDTDSLEKRQNDVKKSNRVHRTEKLSTPDHTIVKNRNTNHSETHRTMSTNNASLNNSYRRKENRIISSHRSNKDNESSGKKDENKDTEMLKDGNDVKKEIRQTSKERSNKKKEYSTSNKSMDQNSSDRVHSKEWRPANRDGGEKAITSNSRRPSRRSEYVIKYDDKNGTVSSISKVRAGHSSSRHKHASKERNKENSKDTRTKTKNVEKSALRNAAPRSSDCERKKSR